MRTNADRGEPWPGLRQLDPAAFGADLDALMDVYRAAMGVAAVQLPGRRAIMEAHAANPGFRGLAVTAPSGATMADPGPSAGPADGTVIAFAYGFHGGRGQWWHDLVRSALISRWGHAAAIEWLDDSFEVAEVHVHPEYQRRGIGRRMLYLLTGYRFSGAPVPYAVMGAALPLLATRS